ncbi:response regulator [Lysobacter xanthus]
MDMKPDGAAAEPGRLLVVEDEYLVADDMRQELEALGACVLGPFATIEAAMAVVGRGDGIDGAILDINVCGETVYPVASALEARNIPFVFWSAYESLSLPVQFRDRPRIGKPATGREALRSLEASRSDAHAAVDAWADVYVDARGDHLIRLRDRGATVQTQDLVWLGLADVHIATWSARLRTPVRPGTFYRVPTRYLTALSVAFEMLG